jgi:CBS domain-containing protein
MPTVQKRSVLSGISVEEAMRRQVIRLSRDASIDYGINRMIKYKINAILIGGQHRQSIGVVSKTDVISAYYAGFTTDMPLEHIMVGPPLFCFPDDELEVALDAMQQNGVHRLYVHGAESDDVIGVIAYPDIVGLLYRYCRVCDRGLRRAGRRKDAEQLRRLMVKEVMTAEVTAFLQEDNLAQVIEGLTTRRLGAALIRNASDKPVGVVSKSDLIVAYKHGVAVDAPAADIMNQPVMSCEENSELADAIQRMLLRDVQRIFVHTREPEQIVGILSLSDAARFRSGSCRACTSSRLIQA